LVRNLGSFTKPSPSNTTVTNASSVIRMLTKFITRVQSYEMPTPWALHNVMYLGLGSQRFQWGKYSNRLLFGVGQAGDFLVAHSADGHLGALGALEVLYIAAQSFS